MTHNEHVYAICGRPKVAGDVISRENLKTIDSYDVLNFEVAGLMSFRNIEEKNHFLTAADIDSSIKRKRIRVSFKNYIFRPPVDVWNKLPGEVASATSVDSLKNRLDAIGHTTRTLGTCLVC